MIRVFLVTPAHGRTGVTRVVFAQRRRMMDELAPLGVDVRCVVVACDDNLDLAAAYGFDTVEAQNGWLGRRYNHGIAYAYEHGADWVLPVGSDDWLHPCYLERLPDPDGPIRTVVRTVIVREDGRVLGHMHVRYPGGCGFRLYPRWLFDLVGPRPADERKPRGVDTSILHAIEHAVGPLRWAPFPDELARVGFKTGAQLNPYRNVMANFGLYEEPDPWGALAEAYPGDLIGLMQDAYGLVNEAAGMVAV